MSDVGSQGRVWRLLGLNIQAPFEVGPEAPCGAAPDVVVEQGDGQPPAASDGRGGVVAEMRTPTGTFYSVYRLRPGYLLRVHGEYDFLVDEELHRVRYWASPGLDEGLVPVFLAGTVTSLLLTLRGTPVLHGSAVNWWGRTVAFAGFSGKGKSTVAALCCAAGARLVCDDVVPLARSSREPGGVACSGLGHELRLRPVAKEIADLFPAPGPFRRITADGRLALRPSLAPSEDNPLSAVVLPQPNRDAQAVTLRRLGPTEAVKELLSNSRIPALGSLDLQKPYFEVVTALAASVPVVEAQVPWGPPFRTASAVSLFETLGLTQE
jgi:hypothetical protein